MATLEQKIKGLTCDLGLTIDRAQCNDIDTKPLEQAQVMLHLIPELFDKIAHGEQGHRDWLKAAIEAHFSGEPMPDYVAK